MIIEKFKPEIALLPGFYLVVDTREQDPLFEREWYVVRKKLDVGDYSIKGFENLITIERKSKEDLLNSLGNERKRFMEEIERGKAYEWKGLLIESSEKDLYIPSRFSSLNLQSLYFSIASIEVRGWNVYYAKERERAKEWVLSRLLRWYKHKRGM